MYCRNCGNQMDNMASVCVKCGVEAGKGTNYCQNCGAQCVPGAAVCTQCGVALAQPIPEGEQKSRLVAGLLAIFSILYGGWGIHNFYLGNTNKAIAQLLLTLCFGIGTIWCVIEGILIFAGKINTDAKGIPLKD